MLDTEATFLSFVESIDCPPKLLEAVLRGYSAIFEDMSGTSDSLYSDGVGNARSDHALGNETAPWSWDGQFYMNTTDIDDSENWNGGEDTDDHPVVMALNLNDMTKVTTAQPEHMDKFHGTEYYPKYIGNLMKTAGQFKAKPEHVGSDEGTVHILGF